ncbi:hypothetical protein R1flu_019240 [Riccia fluitans]|uniref:Uncharacterized protein n=1 Tax=Riccia fluitans TaxID=41844 RepID=A0ABD1ZJ56_9MARC
MQRILTLQDQIMHAFHANPLLQGSDGTTQFGQLMPVEGLPLPNGLPQVLTGQHHVYPLRIVGSPARSFQEPAPVQTATPMNLHLSPLPLRNLQTAPLGEAPAGEREVTFASPVTGGGGGGKSRSGIEPNRAWQTPNPKIL